MIDSLTLALVKDGAAVLDDLAHDLPATDPRRASVAMLARLLRTLRYEAGPSAIDESEARRRTELLARADGLLGPGYRGDLDHEGAEPELARLATGRLVSWLFDHLDDGTAAALLGETLMLERQLLAERASFDSWW